MTTVYPKLMTITLRAKRILILLVASVPLCFAQAPPHESTNGSSFVEPTFLLPANPEVND